MNFSDSNGIAPTFPTSDSSIVYGVRFDSLLFPSSNTSVCTSWLYLEMCDSVLASLTQSKELEHGICATFTPHGPLCLVN